MRLVGSRSHRIRERISPVSVSAFGRRSVSRRTLIGSAWAEYDMEVEAGKCSVSASHAFGESRAS